MEQQLSEIGKFLLGFGIGSGIVYLVYAIAKKMQSLNYKK